MTKEERRALNDLAKNTDLVIKKTQTKLEEYVSYLILNIEKLDSHI